MTRLYANHPLIQVEADDRGQGPRAGMAGFGHQTSPLLHEAQTVLERESARDDKGRVLPDAVPHHPRRLDPPAPPQ